MDSAIVETYEGAVSGEVQVFATLSGSKFIRYIYLKNTTAAIAYLQVFWLPGASVTLGSTVPPQQFGLAPSESKMLVFPGKGLKIQGSGLTLGGTTLRSGSTGAQIDVNIGFS